jgi:hypothetical protein
MNTTDNNAELHPAQPDGHGDNAPRPMPQFYVMPYAPEAELDLFVYVEAIIRRRKTVISLTLIGLLCGLTYLFTRKPSPNYTSEATVLDLQSEQDRKGNDVISMMTLRTLLTSQPFIANTIEPLQDEPQFRGLTAGKIQNKLVLKENGSLLTIGYTADSPESASGVLQCLLDGIMKRVRELYVQTLKLDHDRAALALEDADTDLEQHTKALLTLAASSPELLQRESTAVTLEALVNEINVRAKNTSIKRETEAKLADIDKWFPFKVIDTPRSTPEQASKQSLLPPAGLAFLGFAAGSLFAIVAEAYRKRQLQRAGKTDITPTK